ncbi:MAG TPA: LysM peptidoglycan-binding domain-containing protein [Polyangiales bacterium]
MQKQVQILVMALGPAILAWACQQPDARKPADKLAAKPPAPVVAAPAPPPPDPPSVMHTVSEEETLWDIAHAYGVPVKDIMAANGFRTNDIRRLRKGSQLKIPGATQLVDVQTKADRAAQKEALPALTDGAYHFLRRGEGLWTLARVYDVPLEAIMERNGFTEDIHGQLRLGQAIIIPGIAASRVKQVQDASPKHDGFMHEVSRGETVWDLAHEFQVSVAEIMAANSMTAEEATNIHDGQKLFLPGVEDDGRGHVHRKTSERERRARTAASRLGLGSLVAAGKLLHGIVEPRWIAAAGGGKVLGGTLRWPVSNGALVRGFGSGQGGYHKAMDIMGKMGWNVRAAGSGIVGYAGDQVKGFGNMIMVVHPGGWVTLYAHNSVNFVAAGERVQKGGVLAEVGSTGRSQGPHVHFELIYDGKNCDPAPLFRPGVRYHNGKLARLPYTTWRTPNKRPTQVICAQRQKHPLHSVESENPELDAQDARGDGPTLDQPLADTP